MVEEFGSFVGAALKAFFFQPHDTPPCQARVERVRYGPWTERVTIHPREDGTVRVTPLRLE